MGIVHYESAFQVFVKGLENEIDDLENEIDDLENEIDDLENEIDDLENQGRRPCMIRKTILLGVPGACPREILKLSNAISEVTTGKVMVYCMITF